VLERNQTRTKIVATLGPASATEARIRDMVRSGVDAFRLNMSHGSNEERRRWIRILYRLRRELERPVAVFADLRGPRLRLGRFPGPRRLKRGQILELRPVAEAAAAEPWLPVDYDGLGRDLEPGHRILLRDGRLELVVEEAGRRRIRARVRRGGEILSSQGVNLPDSRVSAPILGPKDLEDIRFAAEAGLDYLALSFVRSAADIAVLRAEMEACDYAAPVIAKIEHPEAVRNLDEILEAADAVMVARGDLAVEMGHEVVPTVQKRIISRAIERATPVITATQMLETMIENSTPTRAEVSDVANAVLDGSDAVMLSGETAVGAWPLQAVRTMHRIVQRTEAELFRHSSRLPGFLFHREDEGPTTVEKALMDGAVEAARRCGARLLLAFTESGRSAKLLSSFRSKRPLIGVTSDPRSFHRMALYWGVRPALIGRFRSVHEMNRKAASLLGRVRWLKPDDLVVAFTGTFAVSGATNTVRILTLSDLAEAARD